MLAEFALTPSVFDEGHNLDRNAWHDWLRELGNGMFPRTAPSPVLVSDLYDGSWNAVTRRIVDSLTDSRSRDLCLKLFKKIEDRLVRRPATSDEWPDDPGIAWAKEAIASNVLEPIDRIIVCSESIKRLQGRNTGLRALEEAADSGFWCDVASQWSQEMELNSQILALRKLTLYSEFLCIINPYIHNAVENEGQFASAVLESVYNRPKEFSAICDIEVHTEGASEPQGKEFAERQKRRSNAVADSFRKKLIGSQSFKLFFWPSFLDRYVIGGRYTSTSLGIRLRSPKWGIAMPHIAGSSTDRTALPTQWSLLSNVQLGRIFDAYCKTAPEPPFSAPLTVAR